MGEKTNKKETAKDYLYDRERYGHVIAGWKCPLCGKVNATYITECSCNKEISTVTYSLDRLLKHVEMQEYQNAFQDLISFWDSFGGKGVPKSRLKFYAKHTKRKYSKPGPFGEEKEAFVIHHEEFRTKHRKYTYDLYSDGSTEFKGFDII